MNQTDLFGATLDNMSDLDDPKQVVSQIADLLVKVTIATIRGKEGFEQEQPVALAAAYMALDSEAEPVSGQEAEGAYYAEYQATWKHELDTAEDSESWNGDFDWTKAGFFPLELLKRVARACASQDAVDTKAWYKWCRENPDVVAHRTMIVG